MREYLEEVIRELQRSEGKHQLNLSEIFNFFSLPVRVLVFCWEGITALAIRV